MSDTGSKKQHRMVTRDGFRAAMACHGFGHMEEGVYEAANVYLEHIAAQTMQQALLCAEAENRTGLNGKHAQKAINETPQIPKGHYGCANN